MKISAVIITCNEEANIERCLASLSFADERIVVDSGSTDKTREIAEKCGARVLDQPWLGYVAQKNRATDACAHDWVLSLDADEEVSPELRKEILALCEDSAPVAYSIPRKTIHMGQWIKHGGWYPDRLVRFYRRSKGRWAGSELHERWETTGKVGELKSDLIHYSFADIADQVSRNNRYSSLGALKLHKQGVRFSFFRIAIKAWVKFFETYILKRGFLDGYPGFIISVSAAYSVFLKWAKLWELEQSAKKV